MSRSSHQEASMTNHVSRRRRHRVRGVCSLALAWALCLHIPLSAAYAWRVPASQDSIPRFVTESDVVLEAEVVEAKTGYRPTAGGCTAPAISPYPLTDARIRVLALYAGVCPVETTDVSLVGLNDPSAIGSSRRVLLWGFHNCRD